MADQPTHHAAAASATDGAMRGRQSEEAAALESTRVEALHDLDILDTPPEERFDRLTRLARRLFDVPIALVSLVDTDRQWFKSHDGLEACETAREGSFCTHAIEREGVFVIPDAWLDIRFRDSPLVTGEPWIRFYAGQPIASPGGFQVGTLCIIDRRPRQLGLDETATLIDLARLVEQEIAALRLATVDSLTGLSNRRGFEILARQALAMCRRTERPASLCLFDLDGFKALNDTLGHAAGDAALASFGADLLANYRHSDVVARLGGDEFAVLLTGTAATGVDAAVDKLGRAVARRNEGRPAVARIRYSLGIAEYDPACHRNPSDLVECADALMYEDKRFRQSERS